jgi:hypothetical protein
MWLCAKHPAVNKEQMEKFEEQLITRSGIRWMTHLIHESLHIFLKALLIPAWGFVFQSWF